MAKSKDNIQLTGMSDKEKDIKTKPKKTKKVIETEKVADVKVDVEQSLIAASELAEIDLRSYNHSDVVGGYIRHKRSI